ncbi:acVLRF1 family peptidyl-tRNA hydrolase [Nocardioides humi]|uniref:Actinobacteria/chloroflexi VLRF1 release factor domain-containing protein n=1 Tax=Nocardioides humi TaxID=449461 RepID=A0ABN2BA52_9ACTN|nr:acVLRF1 family peptidyl-tRNA hydrolase [Nocardioides humi]
MLEVLVPPARWPRWRANFAASHGDPDLRVADGALHGAAPDGSWFAARLPFSQEYDGPPDADALGERVAAPAVWGVLLVRKGGFAVARVEAGAVVASKVGQRHVQGRTKAGGQSQQRFARRRANQARVAYEAAAEHAHTVLAGAREIVTGGDRTAVAEVLADPRLRSLAVVGPWLDVPDPRRAVLDRAVRDAGALVVAVENAAPH